MITRATARPGMGDESEHFTESNGYMTGRTVALADWSFRKDNAVFEKLVATLRAVKWNRDHPNQRRAHSLKWAKLNASKLLLQAKRRRAKNAKIKAAAVIVCKGCAAEFCRVPAKGKGRGRAPLWCTTACYQRAHYHADKVKFIERVEKARLARIDAGECVFCPVGDVRPTEPRRRACRDCAVVMAEKQRTRRVRAA